MKGTEAEYVIPLRKEVMKAPIHSRTKKAMVAVREFLQHHTKSKNVFIGKQLNETIQQYGHKHVIPRVKVKVVKDEEKYKAELIGFPIELDKDKKAKKDEKQPEVKTENLDAKKETEEQQAEKAMEKETIKKQGKAITKQKEIAQDTKAKKHSDPQFRAGNYPRELKK